MYGFDSRLIQSGSSSSFVECFRLGLIGCNCERPTEGLEGTLFTDNDTENHMILQTKWPSTLLSAVLFILGNATKHHMI